jgi:antitoxin HicB
MMTELKYPLTIKPLSKEEGGGYQVEYLDLPGCMADGETVEEALREGEDAVLSWIRSAQEDGEPIPQPRSLDQYSGQWRIRVPKSLHAQLDTKAKLEGVSLNTLSITLLAEGLARKNAVSDLQRHSMK